MTDVWFIRHGESTTNAGEVSKDRSSTTLTALGHEQARAASLAIPKAPDLIVVTPYIRTHQTAAPLQGRFPQTPREIWDLQEFSALSEENYNNRTWTERIPLMQVFWERNDPDYVDGAGAESFIAMAGRVQTAFTHLQTRKEKFIVVFAHGYIIQTARLMLAYPGLPASELMRRLSHSTRNSHIDNGWIMRVHRDAQGLRVHEEDLKGLKTESPSEQVD